MKSKPKLKQYSLGGFFSKVADSIHDIGLGVADTGLSAIGLSNAIGKNAYSTSIGRKTDKLIGNVAPVIGSAAASLALGPAGGAALQGLQSFNRGINPDPLKANYEQQQRDAQSKLLADSAKGYGDPLSNNLDMGQYAMGGMLNPQYEVEQGEVVQGNPQLEQSTQHASDLHVVGGEKHSNGGTEGAGGERVFSDQMKIGKKTYAELATKLAKQKGKLEAKLTSHSEFSMNTANRMLPRVEESLNALFEHQEASKPQESASLQYAKGGLLKRSNVAAQDATAPSSMYRSAPSDKQGGADQLRRTVKGASAVVGLAKAIPTPFTQALGWGASGLSALMDGHDAYRSAQAGDYEGAALNAAQAGLSLVPLNTKAITVANKPVNALVRMAKSGAIVSDGADILDANMNKKTKEYAGGGVIRKKPVASLNTRQASLVPPSLATAAPTMQMTNAAWSPGTNSVDAGFDWKNAGAKASEFGQTIAPYIDNIANSFITPPKPIAPILTAAPKLNTSVDISPELAELNERGRNFNTAIDRSTASSSTARSNKVAGYVSSLGEVGKLYGAKRQQESSLQNQQALLDYQNSAQNNGLVNQYNQQLTATEAERRSGISANISNAALDVQGQIRDKNYKEADINKIGILAKMYNTNGVVDRKLLLQTAMALGISPQELTAKIKGGTQ